MSNLFFEQPILTSPYECPSRHWELDERGHPNQRIVDERRKAEFITPIPGPESGRVAMKVINDHGDEVMKVFQSVILHELREI